MADMELIKTLREKTGAGFLDCKKALEACNNNLDEAGEWLRSKGIAKAVKKSVRIAADGLTKIVSKGNKAVMIEINSETDFVAKNADFVAFVDKIANLVLDSNATTVEEALTLAIDGATLNDYIVNAIAKIGEKLSFRRFVAINKNDNESFGLYSHLGNKISAIVVTEGNNEEVAKDIAMQVAALNPLYLTSDAIPASEVEKEKAVQLELVKQDPKLVGKPQAMLDGIITNKVKKVFLESILLEQPFIKNQDILIKDLLKNSNSKIIKFVRYAVGEGIQKREENFAEEVLKQSQPK